MIETVSVFLNKHNIRNMPVLMALSGGVDSCVLFYILNGLKSKYNLDLKVIHLNHNWPGEDSFLDFEFAKKIADDANCEFYSKTLDDDIKKTELCAREARYEFFEEALQHFNSGVCFLAHNKNDNVETLIYRMIKGTGVSGLASIPAVRIPYYRPLLNVSRDEIEEFARIHNIEHRVDKSNDDAKYKRNFIRKNILPSMLEIAPNALNAMNSLINLANENNEILDDYIEHIEREIFDNNAKCWAYDRPAIKRDAFLGLKPALQREIISRYFKGILKNRDYKNIVKIQNFILDNENSTLSINSDTFLRVLKGSVFLYKL